MKKYLIQALVILPLAAATQAHASELVYVPFNPSFGGNPQNGAVLLNSAQATKKHEDPLADRLAGFSSTERTPLDSFNDTLERAILSRLATAALSEIFDGETWKEGSTSTANYNILIADIGDGTLILTLTDKVTGKATSIQVGGGL